VKKIAILLLLLAVSVTTFCQQNNARPDLTKKDYLKKSKNQKTAAWILLGGGTAMAAGGFIWASSNIFSTSSGPEVLLFVGIGCMTGSIPLFISSSKNRKRAMSASFKFQQSPQRQNNILVKREVPSLTLKISL
jgi:hypothetical protein